VPDHVRECARGESVGDCDGLIAGHESGTELENDDTTVGYFDGGDHLAYPRIDLDACWPPFKAKAQAWVDLIRETAPDTLVLVGGGPPGRRSSVRRQTTRSTTPTWPMWGTSIHST